MHWLAIMGLLMSGCTRDLATSTAQPPEAAQPPPAPAVAEPLVLEPIDVAGAPFDEPMGIDIGADGTVWVADTRHQRVVAVDLKTGTVGAEVGGPEPEQGGLQMPVDVAVGPTGQLYVADYTGDRVAMYQPDGSFVRHLGETGEGPGQLQAAAGVAVDSRGHVWVTDFYNKRVQVFDSNGDLRAVHHDDAVGLNYPTDVALDADGTVWVADAYNHRIVHLTDQGDLRDTWGTQGSGDGQFDVPSGVDVGADGRVWIADSANHRVVALSKDGQTLASWTLPDAHDDRYSPTRLAVAPDGTVIVVDTSNNRLLQVPKVATPSHD